MPNQLDSSGLSIKIPLTDPENNNVIESGKLLTRFLLPLAYLQFLFYEMILKLPLSRYDQQRTGCVPLLLWLQNAIPNRGFLVSG